MSTTKIIAALAATAMVGLFTATAYAESIPQEEINQYSGSDKPDVQAEFNKESFTRGAVGAARTQDPNSFNSQFFICFDDCTFLNGNYTVFGRVASGMETVDLIKQGNPEQDGLVTDPDQIVSARIEYRN